MRKPKARGYGALLVASGLVAGLLPGAGPARAAQSATVSVSS